MTSEQVVAWVQRKVVARRGQPSTPENLAALNELRDVLRGLREREPEGLSQIDVTLAARAYRDGSR